MKISLKWLSKYIALQDHKPQDIAHTLTASGIEVEKVEDKAQAFNKVIIGHIDQMEKHPLADRLTLCQVSIGDGHTHQVVCGATNHKQGDKVVFALPGATLPNGMTIKPVKIKDIMSAGMLCSEAELGLSEESEGILILPKEAPVGSHFAQYKGFDDVVLDINVTSNRCDCLSHLGLARELSALLHIKYIPPTVTLGKSQNTPQVVLTVHQKELCPRYAGRLVRGVKVGQSPHWLVQHLESVGHTSINNVVDVTNFVMLELGQPLHAFDIRFLEGNHIQVDLAKAHEKFTTLDGTELSLDGTELMIRDAEKPVALAGIVGGKNSGILSDTTDVFIEAACFKPEQVRRTCRKFGIETESSYRFSRGIDPETILMALDRACLLIQDVAGGQIDKAFHDFYPTPLVPSSISIHIQDIYDRLGHSVDIQRCHDILTHLGCQVHREEALQQLKITPPSYRKDLLIKEDLIEEIARLEGYEKIPQGKVPTHCLPQPHAREYVLQRRLGQLMAGQGYQQTIHLAFAHLEKQKSFLGDLAPLKASGLHFSEHVSLSNPLSQEQAVLKQSLIPDLCHTMIHNCHHKTLYGRIYEMGYAFLQNTNSKTLKGDKKSSAKASDFLEEWRLGCMAWGRPVSAWQKDFPALVLDVKQHIANLLKALGIVSYQWKTANLTPEFLCPGQVAFLCCEGKNVGYIGTLHPLLLKKHKILVEAVCGEFNLDQLLAHHPRGVKVKAFSRFPSIERDISLVVDPNIEVGQVMQVISKMGGNLLKSVTFFDMYPQKLDPKSKNKSLGFRLSYQKKDGTLKDEDIQQVQNNILDALKNKFAIQLRD